MYVKSVKASEFEVGRELIILPNLGGKDVLNEILT
jgi:hypothetical protein